MPRWTLAASTCQASAGSCTRLPLRTSCYLPNVGAVRWASPCPDGDQIDLVSSRVRWFLVAPFLRSLRSPYPLEYSLRCLFAALSDCIFWVRYSSLCWNSLRAAWSLASRDARRRLDATQMPYASPAASTRGPRISIAARSDTEVRLSSIYSYVPRCRVALALNEQRADRANVPDCSRRAGM